MGVHEHIKDICRRLAKLGYLAVATEYYARIGDLSKMTDVQQIFREVVNRTPDDQLMSDLDSTASWAASHAGDPARLGVTGFCFGGRDTWLYAAHNPQLKAAVAWYGHVASPKFDLHPLNALDIAADLKCPLLGLYGGQDKSIPLEQVHEAEEKAKAAGKTVEIVVFPDAPHGFNADYRPSYREADAKKAWGLMLNWFRKYGVA